LDLQISILILDFTLEILYALLIPSAHATCNANLKVWSRQQIRTFLNAEFSLFSCCSFLLGTQIPLCILFSNHPQAAFLP